MADQPRPAANGFARPTASNTVCPTAGRSFYVCPRRLVTTTPTTVYDGLLPTVPGCRSTSTRYGRFIISRPLVDTARWKLMLSTTYTYSRESQGVRSASMLSKFVDA